MWNSDPSDNFNIHTSASKDNKYLSWMYGVDRESLIGITRLAE